MQKYSCEECVNKNSPLCELCYKIDQPSGSTTKPTYFVSRGEITVMKKQTAAILIVENIINRLPIPINLVIEYNKSIERR